MTPDGSHEMFLLSGWVILISNMSSKEMVYRFRTGGLVSFAGRFSSGVRNW
jgi:hypothetical protein